MKKLVQVQEVEGEGLLALLGQKVTLFCLNYFYTGVLVGVNQDCVQLEDPAIVYETGQWDSAEYDDVQKLPCKQLYVRIAAVEAYGVVK